MPDACPNGSAPAPGAPTLFYLGPALVQELFPAWADWLGQFIPLIGDQLIATADLCATSPNASSDITAADVALALLTPGGMIALGGKMKEAARVQVWNTYCVCNPSTAPVFVEVLDSDLCQPPESITHNAMDPTVPAWHITAQMTSSDAGGHGAWVRAVGWHSGSIVIDTGGQRLNAAEGVITLQDYTGAIDDWELIQDPGDGGAACCSRLIVYAKYPAGTVVTPTPPDPQPQPPDLPDAPPPPSCADLDAVCGAIAQLSQQLSLVNIGVSTVETGVNDIQTVTPAKTLIPAGTSAGNSGDSTHAVADIRAVQVHVTTIPSYKGHVWSDPYTWSDLGVVRLKAGDYWGPDFPIEREFFTLVDVSPLVTTVGLSLAPGVVATVTWLTKGS